MISTSALRAKQFLAEHGPAVAAVLLLVGASGIGAGVWLHQNPETTQVTDYTDEQTVHAELGTRATTTGATGLYDEGETLRDQPVYLREETPEVTLVARTSSSADTDVRVEQRLVLVTTATHDGAVFWSRNRTLGQTQTTAETGVTRATLNISALEATLADRRQRIGGAGELSVHLAVRVHYDTGTYSGTLADRVPITVSEDWYTVPTMTLSNEHRTEVTRTATVPRSRWDYLLPAIGGVVALGLGLAVAGLWFTRLRDVGEDLARQIQHQRYVEWISEGTLDVIDTDEGISVSTVEDLVDVAIDADKRVIYDPERELYAVVDDQTVYYHRPPDAWEWQNQ